MIAAFAIEPFAAFLARFRQHLGKVEKVMGGLLVLTGIAFLTGSITTASFWLLETFPVLGGLDSSANRAQAALFASSDRSRVRARECRWPRDMAAPRQRAALLGW